MAKARGGDGVRVLRTARRSRAALILSTALQASVVMVLALPAAAQPAPNARPQGGVVVAGSATIGQSATATTITQSSQRAALNWQSFNVGSQQQVTFVQPSAGAVALNRVVGPDPSRIAGRIDANGQVILVNQSGVIFYQGAQVNAAGLIVSAAGISNRNFMAGTLAFDQPAKPGAVVENRGSITVKQAGLAALVAPQVANSGVISATLGHVVLAGAKTATLDLYGDGLLALNVTNQVTQMPVGPDGKTATALVTNSGTILAEGGTVQLTARAADGVVQNLVRAGGKIGAASVGGKAGTVVLDGVGGSIVVEGQLAATGDAPGTKGGAVEVVASGNVAVAAGATIDVSGRGGGGVAAIGTTLQRARGGPSVTPTRTARNVSVQKGAVIAANATGAGAGGRVAVLSRDTTHMDGAIAAKGGPQGGAGGFVEVSGTHLGMTGAVDVSAPHGAAGTILLDPVNLDIVAGTGTDDGIFTTNSGTLTVFATGANGTDTISNTVLNGFTGNAVLQAQHTITVDTNVTVDMAHASLTLQAGDSITVGAGASLFANGDVLLETGSAVPFARRGAAPPLISILGAVGSTTGSVVLLAGTGGSVSLAATGAVGAASGQRITIQTDALSVASGAGSLSAPLGTVEIAPATLNGTVSLGGVNGLALAQSVISAVSANVLEIGAVTVANTATTTASGISVDGALDFTGSAPTLALTTSGAVSEVAGGQLLNVGTLSGISASLDLSLGTNSIANVGSYNTAGGAFALTVTGSTTLAGPLTSGTIQVTAGSAGSIDVTGQVSGSNVTLSGGSVSLETAANVQGFGIRLDGASGIVFNGNALMGNVEALVDLTTANGNISEAATSTIVTGGLSSSGGVVGDVRLLGKNAISGIDGFAVSSTVPGSGNFALTDTVALTVYGQLTTTGNIYLQSSNAGGISVYGLVMTGVGKTASFQTDALVQASSTPGLSGITTGTFELAPNSPNATMTLGTAGILTSLAGISSTEERLGAVTQPGSTTPTTLAGGIVVAGGFDFLHTVVELDANGPIDASAGVLTNVATLRGTGTTWTLNAPTNSVSALGNIVAGSFTLNDGVDLSVPGALSAGSAATIIGAGTVSVAGTIALSQALATSAVALQGTTLTIAGLVSDGGAGTTSLVASNGGLTQTGKLIAGTLSGSASGAASLTGANTITTLGDFSAAGFTLSDGRDLTVAGANGVQGGPSATISDSGTLTVASGISANAISLGAAAMVLNGLVSDGGAGTVALLASPGGITQTGTLIAGTLSGGAGGAASLTGSNTITTLGGFSTGGDLTLTNTRALTVAGAVSAGAPAAPAVGNTATLGLTVGGALQFGIAAGAPASLNAGTVSLNAAGPITEANATLATNNLIAATTGNGGSILLTNPANQIAASGGLAALNGDVVLVDDPTTVLSGTYSGGNLFFEVALAGGSLGIGGAVPATLTVPSGGRITLVADAIVATPTSVITAPAGRLELSPFSAIPVDMAGSAGAGTLELDTTLLGIIGGGASKLGTIIVGEFTDVAAVTAGSAVRASAITLSGAVALGNTATDLGLLANGPITEPGGVLTVPGLFGATSGAGGDFALGAATNAIGQSSGIVATNGNVALVDGSNLTLQGGFAGNNVFVEIARAGGTVFLGSLTNIPATLTAVAGGRVSLVADAIAEASGSAWSAIGGTMEVSPFSAINASLFGTSGWVVDTKFLSHVTTGTLLVGGFTDLPAGATAPTAAASSLSIDGTTDLTGIATTLLLEATGPITQPGGPIVVTQLGGSGGSVALLHAGNTIGTLLDFAATAGNLSLADATALTVAGAVSARGTTPGSGNVFLQAGAGGILVDSQGGQIVAGTAGLASVQTDTLTVASGATVTGGTFEFAPLPTSPAATVTLGPGGGLVSLAGIGTGMARIGAVTQPGATAPATTAGAITVAGIFDATGLPVELDAFGPITATVAPLVNVGTLSGSGGAWTLTAANLSVAALGNIVASSFVLTDTTPLTIAGSVAAGSSASIDAAGTLTVAAGGSLAASAIGLGSDVLSLAGTVGDGGTGSVALVASAGGIAETGTLVAGTLSGSASGAATFGGTNSIATLNAFSAGNSFALTDSTDLLIAGLLTAPGILVQVPGHGITLGNGATLVTGGVARPPGVLVPADEPAQGAPGALLQAARVTQNGSSTLSGLNNGPATLQIRTTAGASFDPKLGLNGGNGWLILDLAGGTATGNVVVQALDVTYMTPGSASLTGAIQGVTGQGAAPLGFIQPAIDTAYRFNGCMIASPTCNPPPPPPPPTTTTTTINAGPVPLPNIASLPLFFSLQNLIPRILLSPPDQDNLGQLPVVSEQDY